MTATFKMVDRWYHYVSSKRIIPNSLIRSVVIFSFQPTRAQWQKVFYISAGVYVFGWMVYLLLGSGREQPWNTPYETLLVPGNIPKGHKPVVRNILSINNADNDCIDSSQSS